MKKIFFLAAFLFIVCSVFTPLHSQQWTSGCSGYDLSKSIGALPSYAHQANIAGPYYIKVYVHALTDGSGNGGATILQANDMMDVLNNEYNPHDIYFYWDCFFNEIPDDFLFNYHGNPSLPLNNLYGPYNHSDGIDIFLGDPNYLPNGGGRAISNPGDAFFVFGTRNGDLTAMLTATVIHEMGHCLGLFHTMADAVGETQCEYVNGDDWQNRGDFVKDTPADAFNHEPNQSCEVNEIPYAPCVGNCPCGFPPSGLNPCTFCGTYDADNDITLDANTPPGKYVISSELFVNYMGPGNYDDHCKTLITPGQVERMHQMIEFSGTLQNVLIAPPGC